MMSLLDLTPDQLLSTTRAVCKRLDLSRPVEPELIRECIELAVQAPTGGNSQQWHFVIVTDAEKRKALADVLGIPYNDLTQSSLIPVAYTLGGTDFKPGPRKPL